MTSMFTASTQRALTPAMKAASRRVRVRQMNGGEYVAFVDGLPKYRMNPHLAELWERDASTLPTRAAEGAWRRVADADGCFSRQDFRSWVVEYLVFRSMYQ